MAIFRTGDMWSVFDEVDHFLITTNAFIKTNGELVMGRGIAKQARDKFPGLALRMGRAIQEFEPQGAPYGVILGKKLGAFQVKYHFKDQARLDLITYSTEVLRLVAEQYPELRFALNFPGIGNGNLPYHWVKPIVDTLPDNVEVWTFEK